MARSIPSSHKRVQGKKRRTSNRLKFIDQKTIVDVLGLSELKPITVLAGVSNLKALKLNRCEVARIIGLMANAQGAYTEAVVKPTETRARGRTTDAAWTAIERYDGIIETITAERLAVIALYQDGRPAGMAEMPLQALLVQEVKPEIGLRLSVELGKDPREGECSFRVRVADAGDAVEEDVDRLAAEIEKEIDALELGEDE